MRCPVSPLQEHSNNGCLSLTSPARSAAFMTDSSPAYARTGLQRGAHRFWTEARRDAPKNIITLFTVFLFPVLQNLDFRASTRLLKRLSALAMSNSARASSSSLLIITPAFHTRKARDSNPQPLSERPLSRRLANHSLTFHEFRPASNFTNNHQRSRPEQCPRLDSNQQPTD